MLPLFRVKKAGVYGSIQDLGRFGYRRFGVPVSGPMDAKAFQIGHYILGNHPNSPALELFLGGQEFEVLEDHRIVITGADLGATLDGKRAATWKSFDLYKGQTLKFTKSIAGSIVYVIPEGGFQAEQLLGSASVYPKGGLGRSLERGMILYAARGKTKKFQTGLVQEEIPEYAQEVNVHVWPSPHLQRFKQDSIAQFFQAEYRMKTGDRMGYLFAGPALEFKESGDILSEATQFGTIQVPTNGFPIVLHGRCPNYGWLRNDWENCFR